MHERGIAANEVDADGLCGAVQCLFKASGLAPGFAPASMAMGVTAMRLFTIGMPYSRLMSSPVLTRFSCLAANFVVDLRAGLINIGIDAVEEAKCPS